MRYYCVRQHDQRDCGSACLATIAKDYGLNMPLAYFRNLTKTDFNGVNIYGLVETAHKIGFDSMAYEIEFEDLFKNKNLNFPLIAQIVNEQNFYHFVVINKINNKKILISDPSKGKSNWLKDDFRCVFTGYIIVCTPNNQFEPRKEKTKTAVFFKHLISENKKTIGFVCIVSLLITFCGIVFSYGIRYEFQTLEDQEQLVARYGKIDMEIVEEEHKQGNTTEEEYAYILFD